MSANPKRNEGAHRMPVKELPMPPVKIQPPDSSGGSALKAETREVRLPVPNLSALTLRV
jgi:hypothetical protein